jgi:lipoyl-dependent peroxiredoxin
MGVLFNLRARGRPIFKDRSISRLTTIMRTIHIAEMIAEGGRDGRVESPDGTLEIDLASDEKSGSVTPEHLFAGAYAACFLGSLKTHADAAHLAIEGLTVTGRAHLEEDAKGDYQLNVDLRATLPGVAHSDAEHLMNLAHQTCPYSKATRGNVVVNLSFD